MGFKFSECVVDCLLSLVAFVAFLHHVFDGGIVNATSQTPHSVVASP
jgi:hypothetical protein